ncbi:Fatty acid hydroxylase superfamily protein [Thalassovita gelatinovora]|uniref:Fatty acid hydroxylase superfamily protein n=1 Tax=Thalassovita gelatinovora TaxID=53501 RepID=A0A0P1G2I0_THAGE|nr:sterol desaturase family protein [Thalassovita gelatinovora]QIZ81808.1 sterol desaturase family protein [Thalassovita gelatinovora]CUH67085.1 Fatty acid hydroxylase superfamily protein [Thalassovita gelatinovora]SEP80902.1 Sterol desaturase/sphingolipid hydroxylase, fatty acid hydroxylase superfamily [Thalassovita gelatinovora]
MENETIIRLSAFLGLFVLFALLETLVPRKTRTQALTKRWATNWAMQIIDAVALKTLALVLPLLAVGAAIDAGQNGWGVFNRIEMPVWAEVVLAILIFDLAIWFQHLITHKIPILWRFHRVHHADRDIDVTTAIRFHPVEIAFSMLLKIGLVYLIGPSAVTIILFEIILNGTALFNHANLRLPLGLDAIMRLVLVTPDMHRVHHSVLRQEHDSNYGFALSIWDRVFHTYIAQPQAGHDGMTIGLQWQDDRPTRLGWALALPFFRK